MKKIHEYEKFNAANEEAVKHESDQIFAKQLVADLEKIGYNVSFDAKDGTMIIRKGDDQIKFEFYY